MAMRRSEVGELRPSQVLTTFGVGSLVDLPSMSVMVMGIDDWQVAQTQEISEQRLLDFVQEILGPQVRSLRTPPRGEETFGSQANWFDDSRQIGVPVAPFPRWMVCTSCRLLAPLKSGLFEPKVIPYRPDKACYIHRCTNIGKPPLVVPARFLVCCKKGHLDDFPWLEFVHRGPTDCKGPLKLFEVGASGEAADVQVTCERCNISRRMAQAFGPDNQQNMPACRGRRPHLRDFDSKGCDVAHVQPILQGASNLWFPILVSALSVPQANDELGRLIEENWAVLEKASSVDVLVAFRQIGQLKDFVKFSDAQLWEAIEKKRAGTEDADTDTDDLKSPEWQVFSNPKLTKESRTFKLRPVGVPDEFAKLFTQVVLVEKIREVRALVGFTRLESARDLDRPDEFPADQRARISRRPPEWVPSCETFGEGIFLQFSEPAIQAWTRNKRVFDQEFFEAHRDWRIAKNLDPDTGYPGLRYILLHSFAHAIIRQLAIECGYTTASIAERIYSRNPDDGDPMAGVLIYTSAPDSEGTLGGLCSLGHPDKLGRHIRQALETIRLCASDPLCAEHAVTGSQTLHAAACHACSFLPETSCERGSKYLDRTVLVKTVHRDDLAFFE